MTPLAIKDFAAASVVARALLGKLIGPDGVRVLLGSADIGAAFSYLEHTGYGDAMAGLPRAERIFRDVEHALRQSLIDDGIRIARFLGGGYRQVVRSFLARYEITNIKAVIGVLAGGEDLASLRGFLFELGPLKSVDSQALLECSDVEAVARVLRGTPYGAPLRDAMERYRREKTLFAIEVALDLQYFRDLITTINKLGTADRRSTLRVVGPEIDGRNLLWVLRYRFNFGLVPEEIFNYISPVSWELTDMMLWNVARAEDLEEIAAALPREYGEFIKQARTEHGLDLIRLDILLRRRLWRKALDVMRSEPISPGMVAGYLVAKRIELDEIITVLEGKRYAMPEEEIGPFLIHSLGSELPGRGR